MKHPKFHVKHHLDEKTSSQIEQYIELLKNYNETTNIYSKSAYDKLDFHIKDCINIAELCENKPQIITDFGSGSGLPSIIIAICCPLSNVIALESKSRKTKFLELAKQTLKLSNYTVITQNINEWIYHNSPQSDIITAKAFAPFEKCVHLAQKIAKNDSKLIIPISQAQRIEMKSISNKTAYLEDPELNSGYLITKLSPTENSKKQRRFM